MAGLFKTFRGGRLDLQFYKGMTTMDYEVEVLNDDESEFDLTVYDDIKLKILHKIHGTVVLTLGMEAGEITLYSPSDNFVIINVSDTQIVLRPKEYWYTCYGVRDDDEQELIFYGIAKVL